MKTAIGVLVIVVLGLAGIKLLQEVTSDDPEPVAAPLPRATAFPVDEPFWGKVKSFTPVSENVLEVKVKLLNTGNAPDVGECDVVPYTATGAVSSLPVTTGEPATPGFGVPLTKRLKIPGGAATIERVEVAC